MNLVKFLDTQASSIAKAAPQRMSARQEREEAALAEQRYASAEKLRKKWLDATTHDALLIGFGKIDCKAELIGANNAVIFALCSFENRRVEKRVLDGLLQIVRDIQAARKAYKGCPPPALAGVVAAGLATVHDIVRGLTPMQILQASITFEKRFPEVVAHGMALEMQDRVERATLSIKNRSSHLVTFGQTLH